MTSLPAGIETFDALLSKVAASRNFTVSVHGGPKTGKSHFAFHSNGPRYVVYLDTNPNVHTHMLKTEQQYGSDIYHMIISPKKYKTLTVADAQQILDDIEAFRDWAIENATQLTAAGKHGGTFIVDGMIFFKGYCEKAILGESITLGWRPTAGESTRISTYDYAKPNGAVFEFMSSFANKPLDAVFVWEGRPVYKDLINGAGRVESKRTDAWRSTRPDRIPFAVSAEIETLKVFERLDPANNQSPLLTIPKIRIILSAETIGMDNMVIPYKTFDEFKKMMLEPTTGEFEQIAVPAAAIVRANDTGMQLVELVEGDDDDEE